MASSVNVTTSNQDFLPPQTTYQYTFTIFTPTYNRAYSLHRVYESLQSQTCHNFEWLIIDDGSTDNTQELIKKWQEEANFPISYIWQKNIGKAKTSNRGAQMAQGELFLTFDSDDACIPETLERFEYYWNSIPESERDKFSGVTALCKNQDGKIVGNQFPSDIFDSNSFEIESKYLIFGEKWGFQKTDVMKQFPYPEIEGEKFINESYVWHNISLKYKTRFVNEVLRIYYEDALDGITTSSIKLRANNPKGSQIYYKEYSQLPIPTLWKFKGLINYVRFSLHGGNQAKDIIRESGSSVLAALLYLFGFLFYKKDLSVLYRENPLKHVS